MNDNIADDVRKQLDFDELDFDDLEKSDLYEGIKLPVTYADYFGEGGQVSVFTAAKNVVGEIVEINDDILVVQDDSKRKQYFFAIEHITCICVSIDGECIDE